MFLLMLFQPWQTQYVLSDTVEDANDTQTLIYVMLDCGGKLCKKSQKNVVTAANGPGAQYGAQGLSHNVGSDQCFLFKST